MFPSKKTTKIPSPTLFPLFSPNFHNVDHTLNLVLRGPETRNPTKKPHKALKYLTTNIFSYKNPQLSPLTWTLQSKHRQTVFENTNKRRKWGFRELTVVWESFFFKSTSEFHFLLPGSSNAAWFSGLWPVRVKNEFLFLGECRLSGFWNVFWSDAW